MGKSADARVGGVRNLSLLTELDILKVTPTDVAMDALNMDFQVLPPGGFHSEGTPQTTSAAKLRAFYVSEKARLTPRDTPSLLSTTHSKGTDHPIADSYGNVGTLHELYRHTLILSERTMVNYARNLLAFGIRFAMYGGMGVMLATIWIHIGYSASTINDRLSVHFYSVSGRLNGGT
jgi:hypothetical protein